MEALNDINATQQSFEDILINPNANPIEFANAKLLEDEHFIVEANVLSLPIFNYSTGNAITNNTAGIYTHHFTQIVKGEPVSCSITVPKVHTKSDPDGRFLNGFDQDVLIALMDLWQDQGRRSTGVVKFKASDIAKKLKLSSDGGRVFEQIRSSIQLLTGTSISHNNAFRVGNIIMSKEVPVKFLSDYKIEEAYNQLNRKYLLFEVTLSRSIVDNLLTKFTGKIRRDEYLSLRSPLAKRIFQYIEFNNERISQGTNRYTYELIDLSARLSMRGANNPSSIKQRISRALMELKDKNIYDHHFDHIENKHFITFIDLSNYEFLVGVDKLDHFLSLIKKVYNFNLSEKLPYTVYDLEDIFKKYDRVIEFASHKYSWVYHVISIYLYQICDLKMQLPKKPLAYVEDLLRKKDDELDRPRGFRPIDQRYEATVTKQMSQEKAISVTTERENSAVKFKEFAEKYFDQFPDNLRNEYVSRVLKTFDPNVFPDMKDAFIRERAIGLLAEDILNGKLQSI